MQPSMRALAINKKYVARHDRHTNLHECSDSVTVVLGRGERRNFPRNLTDVAVYFPNLRKHQEASRNSSGFCIQISSFVLIHSKDHIIILKV